VGAKVLKRFSSAAVISVVLAFFAGLFSHVLYHRWTAEVSEFQKTILDNEKSELPAGALRSFRVVLAPTINSAEHPSELPVIQALDVEKIRSMTGKPARIRGRIFRVGHAAKSNTYFLNFGPSRSALTAVIFASAVDLFERGKLPPSAFDGREVEIHGKVADHPQYGLEVILENPSQVRILK
jgi:hypothetical protein